HSLSHSRAYVFSAVARIPSFIDVLARFANGHNVPGNIWMCHSYWTALFNLRSNALDHRTVRPEDITKPSSYKARMIATLILQAQVQRLYIYFCYPLTSSHHVSWVYRFIG